VICPNCGSSIPDGARFCPACGTPLPTAVGIEERKIVTVLFADLVDSTGLAQRLDPERAREVISAFYDLASQELASLRGRAEKFIGDAVMAVFGLPVVHEDDAVRAVRAALQIRERTQRLGEELGLQLETHAGLASGDVAVGKGPAGQLLVTGSTVNLAARLQEEAASGETLLAETTHLLTAESVEVAGRRAVGVGGFDGTVAAYPVVRIVPRRTRRTIPLVGRRHEVNLLRDTFDRAVQSKRPHLFTLLGEPGIGKTRLVQEFVAGLDENVRVLTGRAVGYGGQITYWPLVEMLRSEAGIAEEDPPQLVRRRLAELAEGCCEPEESGQVAARLAIALGVGQEEETARPQQDPGAAHRTLVEGAFPQQEIQHGFKTLLRGMSGRGPVALILEDAHAAKPAMLDLVDHVVRRIGAAPLFVLTVAREDLLEHRREWGSGLDAVTLRLDPLDPEQSAELALASGGEAIDLDTARAVAEQTGGNPFFIVETTGMLMHASREGEWRRAPLPMTVQAVVASRLDHLNQPARDLARKMSVFRPPVHRTELALVAAVTEQAIRELEEEEILVPDDRVKDAWRFRHQFLRDVAYESLPKRERVRLHAAAADRLDQPDLKRRFPEALAYHLEQAARNALDLDPTDRTPADRAKHALGEAGDRLRRRMDFRGSIDLYERALALAGPNERWGEDEAGIQAGIGESQYWLAEYSIARANLERALEIAPDSLRVQAHASRFLGDIVLNVDGDVDGAEALFDRARAAADAMDDPWVTARVKLMAAWVYSWRGDPQAAEREWREALEIAHRNGDRWAEARALGSLCSTVSSTGDEREAQRLAEQALRLGEEGEDRFSSAVALQHIGNSYRRTGRYAEAIEPLDRAIVLFDELGARWEWAASIGDRGHVRLVTGDLDAAERDLKKAQGVMEALEEKGYLGFIHEALALVAAQRGDASRAERHLGLADRATSPDEFGGEASLLEARGEVLWLLGDRQGARESFGKALEFYTGTPYVNAWARLATDLARRYGEDTLDSADLKRARKTMERSGWALPPLPVSVTETG